ncbi:MAG: NAD(P)-dependent glycerol-3-phosphate dehydrogenase [Kiritimatiellae bacterium]|jgi:glycerol-3-phosphate dehydrogenase (NAD(P)+)|nr:NAD(P)-dependent glycerol-3-phosphate dehydrogenase [Kiritimatiellia bacterium]
MSKAVVIGDGGWGTALAMILSENGHDVTVWGPFEEYIEKVKAAGVNETFLPGVKLPGNIKWTCNREEAVKDADLGVIAVPTKYYISVLEGFKGLIEPKTAIVSVAKGLDKETHKRMTELAVDILDHPNVSALSGPSHAEEVARGIPTAVTIATDNAETAEFLQTAFSNGHFRVYTSSDKVGVELGGAMKNVIAIGVGISDGLGFGDNTRAALITRGLAEIARLGVALGAHPKTFYGLSGMGDLIVTCTSQLSRNRGVGERIGKGEKIDDIMGNMQMAVEGVWNAASCLSQAEALGVDVPLTKEVYEVIYNNKDPKEAVVDLLSRDLKPENS